MVGVGRVGCKNVRLTDEKLLLVGTERVPFLKLRSAEFGLAIRPRRELGIRRDYTEPFLVGEDRLAQLFPALIEQVHVADLLDPLWRGLVRCVRAAGHVIEEEWLVWRGVIQPLQVVDRVVGHVGDEVVAGVSDPRKDLCRVAEEKRRPLVGLAPHEAVEVIEPHPARPLVKGPRRTYLIAGRVVVLAEPRRRVAVLLQDRTDGGTLRPDDGVVPRVSSGHFGDHAKAHRVMVAARDQRRPASASREQLSGTGCNVVRRSRCGPWTASG